MNMQAMLKQAQKMQKGMLDAQKEIEAMEFEGKSSIVTVKMNGKKQIQSVKIDSESLDKDAIKKKISDGAKPPAAIIFNESLLIQRLKGLKK